MRAVVCESWREFDALEVKDIPAPPLRPGGVRIRVAAAGVSFATQLVVAGKYQRKPPLPFVPGTEIVGTVLESAADVAHPLAPGTRVFAVLDWGGLAEEAVADAIHVVPVPDGLPLEAAVAMPISYPTAAAALLWRARLQPDDWVLVQGAAAGVGLAGVEVARALGARVIARCGAGKRAVPGSRGAAAVLDSAAPFRDAVREITNGEGVAAVLVQGAAAGVGLAGVEVARALGARVIARCGAAKRAVPGSRGAAAVLDSAAPFRDAVREITNGQGVATVLDTLGGAAFDEGLRCLADGGTLVTIGFAAGAIPQLPVNLLLLKNIAVAGLNWGTYVGWSPGDNRGLHAPAVRAVWDQLIGWWQAGLLRPEIHAGFPLEQFREAMAEVRSRRATGRVVLRP